MPKKNSMGSEVAEGFACKPKTHDPNKPISFAAGHIFICDGERCKHCHTPDMAGKLRELIKEMGLDKGEDRIKVTRTGCNGACRYKVFAYAYQNGNARSYNISTCFSAWKNVHMWTRDHWKKLIHLLLGGRISESLREFAVEDKIYY